VKIPKLDGEVRLTVPEGTNARTILWDGDEEGGIRGFAPLHRFLLDESNDFLADMLPSSSFKAPCLPLCWPWELNNRQKSLVLSNLSPPPRSQYFYSQVVSSSSSLWLALPIASWFNLFISPQSLLNRWTIGGMVAVVFRGASNV
jgi:hypothetical protein